MTVLAVLSYPNRHLSQKTTAVCSFDDALHQNLDDMLETMYETNGCGLAANQVGLDMRVIVMDLSENADQPVCLINPKILEKRGTATSQEGCLSFPGLFIQVKRAKSIVYEYYDKQGQKHTKEADGLESFCVQHEIEHLDGITFLDKVSALKRSLYLKKMKKHLEALS